MYDNMQEITQALRYKIWDLGLASKSHYKGKIWAFGTKLGLFWDHSWTMQKTCEMGKKMRCRNIFHFKIYLMVSKKERAR